MPGLEKKGVYRSGARFDCPQCGSLWKDEKTHIVILAARCPECGSDLKLVGVGTNPSLVGDARWFRCVKCKSLFMQRRGEVVATAARSGFTEFTQF